MKIEDIYKKYQIMPSLQMHQYRVAAVANQLIDDFEASSISVSKKEILVACLLHDMGNIIKFDLGLLPELLEPQGIIFWKEVQAEFVRKYGIDEHIATKKIAIELEISERSLFLLDSIGFSKGKYASESEDPSVWIVNYADTRVTPQGITSQKDRLNSSRSRNEHRFENKKDQLLDFEEGVNYLVQVEENIFRSIQSLPKDITDESVKQYIEDLRSFEL